MQESNIFDGGETVTSAEPLEFYGIQWTDGERFTRPVRAPLSELIEIPAQGEADGTIHNQS
jgi:hypothetical protein